MFTEEEKQHLGALLSKAAVPQDALTIDGLHGFLFGLTILPETIMPSEWLPGVFGEEMTEFDNMDEAQEMMGRLFTAYNRIIFENQEGRLEFPFDIGNLKGDDLQRIREWAFGLFRAMSLNPEAWGIGDERDEDEMSEDEREIYASAAVITAVAFPEERHEIFPAEDGKVQTGKEDTKFQARLFTLLPMAVRNVQDHGNMLREESRKQGARRPAFTRPEPRSVEKIGRNDSCPCGSGKKYKKCCGG